MWEFIVSDEDYKFRRFQMGWRKINIYDAIYRIYSLGIKIVFQEQEERERENSKQNKKNLIKNQKKAK